MISTVVLTVIMIIMIMITALVITLHPLILKGSLPTSIKLGFGSGGSNGLGFTVWGLRPWGL